MPTRVLLAAFFATAAVAAPHREITSRYVVETDTFPEVARSLAGRLEAAHPLLEDRFGPLPPGVGPLRVVLHGTRRAYLTEGDGVEGALGHYDAGLDACALVWRGETGDSGWPIAVHEACHRYLRRLHPDFTPPSWYGEGVACYFEGLQDPLAERGVARLRLPGARAALEAGEARLDDVLETRAEVRRGRFEMEGFSPSRFYALAWSLVHFLATERPRDFRRFELRLLAARPQGARETHARWLLAEECGDLDALERAWHEHIRALPVPPAPPSPPVYAWELAAENAWTRYAALSRLPAGALPEDVAAGVARCLADPHPRVRGAAAAALCGRLAPRVADPLAALLDDEDPEVALEAVRALADPAAARAVPRLLVEARHRPDALRALAAIGDPRAAQALRDAVLDRTLDAGVRAECAAALARDRFARPALVAALADENETVRTAARRSLDALAEDPPAASGPAGGDWLSALQDLRSGEAARVQACRRAAAARAEEAVPHLRRLCSPSQPERVRLEAARALVEITGDARGFRPGQPPREREAAYRALSQDSP